LEQLKQTKLYAFSFININIIFRKWVPPKASPLRGFREGLNPVLASNVKIFRKADS